MPELKDLKGMIREMIMGQHDEQLRKRAKQGKLREETDGRSEQGLPVENDNELVRCAKRLDPDVEAVRLFRVLGRAIIDRQEAENLPVITIDQVEGVRMVLELHVGIRDYQRDRRPLTLRGWFATKPPAGFECLCGWSGLPHYSRAG
jgi:hypothetical protein